MSDDRAAIERILVEMHRQGYNLTSLNLKIREKHPSVRGLSYKNLAAFVSERRLPGIETLNSISELLGISLEWIVYGQKPELERRCHARRAVDRE